MNYFSTFSGIGGFELGINQAYELSDGGTEFQQQDCTQGDMPGTESQETRRGSNLPVRVGNANGSKVGGIESDQEGDQRQRFLSQARQGFSSQNRRASERVADQPNERPLCVGYSEIDRYAVATYEHHFPGHKNYGDITAIDADRLPDFDLLVGGFPCQAFSVAGKRRGFLDETRGTLFFDLARILAAKRPKYFVFENVNGLLSHDGGRTFDTIITALDELRYDLQWQVLNSKDWGVPQNRERVFIVGHLRGEPRPEVFPIFGAAGKDIKQVNNARHDYDRLYQASEVAPALNTGQRGNAQPKIAETSVRRLTPTECERLQGFPDAWTLGSDTQRYKQCGNAVTVNVVQAVMQRLFNQPNN